MKQVLMAIDNDVANAPRGLPPGVLGIWLRDGARTAFMLRPRSRELNAEPALLALLLVIALLLGVALQRLLIPGPADFYAAAIQGGWLGSLIMLWLCFVVARSVSDAEPATSAAALFALLLAQGIVIALASGVVLVPLAHTGSIASDKLPRVWAWVLWLAPSLWHVSAQIVLLLRVSWPRRALGGFVIAVACVPHALNLWLQPAWYWYPRAEPQSASTTQRFHLTQEVMERQPAVLASALQRLAPQRAGVVDLYAITFAPYAEEDVFRREVDLVDTLMRERFDAHGRTVQLLNHRDTALERPWATGLNLQRAIARIATLMDRDEDILFIHLTSHGAANGQLSASLRPMELEPVTPAALKRWLAEAGVRYSVISVSACYSGSWIAPLAGDGTLVMTAADADHTSYGCGHKSELTFFGRAMYAEQLRHSTRSFERAHAAAREVIRQREVEAGKDDGYSNPQIAVGAGIRERLARLEARLSGASADAEPAR